MRSIDEARTRLKSWLQESALPMWASHGQDPGGGYWENLHLDGSPDADSPRRVRVQARLAYVYAHAAHLGWYKDAQKASDHAWHYLATKGLQGGTKGCAHLLNPDGSLHDGMRDTYAQAFLVLACAWRWRAFKDRQALILLEDTVAFLQSALRAPNGGWLEGLPPTLPRRQNAHMHLFEAFLAAYEATKDNDYLDLATSIFDLFEQYFFDHKTHIIHEYFDQDWHISPQSEEAIEPGHMFEWCWLLHWFAEHHPGKATHYAEKLFRKARQIGLNPKTGLVVNRATAKGKITDGQSRLWPQAEFIKACAARMQQGHSNAGGDASRMIDLVFEYYLGTPTAGGWHDLRGANGALRSTTMPASTFYHIFGMIAETERIAPDKN